MSFPSLVMITLIILAGSCLELFDNSWELECQAIFWSFHPFPSSYPLILSMQSPKRWQDKLDTWKLKKNRFNHRTDIKLWHLTQSICNHLSWFSKVIWHPGNTRYLFGIDSTAVCFGKFHPHLAPLQWADPHELSVDSVAMGIFIKSSLKRDLNLHI